MKKAREKTPLDEGGRLPESIMAVDSRERPDEGNRKPRRPFAISFVTTRFSIPKLFKSEKQEMIFYLVGTVICLTLYIILSTIRELQL